MQKTKQRTFIKLEGQQLLNAAINGIVVDSNVGELVLVDEILDLGTGEVCYKVLSKEDVIPKKGTKICQ